MAGGQSFGERLTVVRKARGLSQRALSDKTGIRDNHICRYEKNGRSPSLSIIKRLCRALDCSPNALIHIYRGNKYDN